MEFSVCGSVFGVGLLVVVLFGACVCASAVRTGRTTHWARRGSSRLAAVSGGRKWSQNRMSDMRERAQFRCALRFRFQRPAKGNVEKCKMERARPRPNACGHGPARTARVLCRRAHVNSGRACAKRAAVSLVQHKVCRSVHCTGGTAAPYLCCFQNNTAQRGTTRSCSLKASEVRTAVPLSLSFSLLR